MTIRRKSKTPRPLRGTPAQTRTRLVAAAAQVFNRSGYHGTDSNRIARAAGYSPGTFYKHFADKREIFLAAFQEWVDQEWGEVEREVAVTHDPEALARRIVDLTLRHHIRWRGLRASMLALVGTDPVVRRFHRAQRRRQLRHVGRASQTQAGPRTPPRGGPRPALHDGAHLRRGGDGRASRPWPLEERRSSRRCARRCASTCSRGPNPGTRADCACGKTRPAAKLRPTLRRARRAAGRSPSPDRRNATIPSAAGQNPPRSLHPRGSGDSSRQALVDSCSRGGRAH